MSVNYSVLDESVWLNFNHKTVQIRKGDPRFEDVLQAIREKRLNDIPALADMQSAFEGTGIEIRDGVLVDNEKSMPKELSDRILKFKEQQLPYDALFKFWENLKKNPSYNSRAMLYKFLEHNGHPLTEDGCFIAYRGVTEDFKDVHTKTFDNKPGSVCEMPRSEVDDDPNKTCSAGLHVACFDYAKGFGEKMVEVKVNPADVVCVPVDYNGTKMRTCRFEVVAETEKPRSEQLYDHDPSEEEEEEGDDYDCYDCEDAGCIECQPDNFCANPTCGEEREPFGNFCPHCGHEH